MGLNYLLSDGKTQARASRPRFSLIVGLIELIEDPVHLVRGNSRPGIADAHPDPRFDRVDGQLDSSAVRRELERVRQQVADHLVDTVEVPEHLVGEAVAALDAERDLALYGEHVECSLEIGE